MHGSIPGSRGTTSTITMHRLERTTTTSSSKSGGEISYSILDNSVSRDNFVNDGVWMCNVYMYI